MNAIPSGSLRLFTVVFCLALSLSGARAFTVLEGQAFEFSGPDDLFLNPASNVIAVNVVNGSFEDLDVNGVLFQGDGGNTAVTGTTSKGAVTVTTSRSTAPNGGEIPNWAVAPEFTGGTADSAINLANIMQSIRWAQGASGPGSPIPGAGLDVTVEGLIPGTVYDIQLLFDEGGDRDRRFDIAVEGVLVVDDFSSEGGDGVWTPTNSFAYRGQFAPSPDGILDIRLEADLGGDPFIGADGNPILNAIVIHNLAPVPPSDILLSKDTFTATAPLGTVVGLLSSVDNNGGPHTYTLVPGAGATSNALFQIDGNALETNSDFSALGGNTFSIRVRSTDGGGLFLEEVFVITASGDGDNDNLSDSWELMFAPNLVDLTGLKNGPGPGADTGDFDNDALSDLKEFTNGTDPKKDDTDADGSKDGSEVTNGTNPKKADTDDDGLNDGDEASRGTNPLKADSDGDTLLDGEEVTSGTNPLLVDTDGDTYNDNVDSFPLDPTLFSPTIVLVGEVIEFKGPDDLHLDPATAVIAVNAYGAEDLDVNGVNFQADGQNTGSGTVTNGAVTVTTSATHGISNWAARPAFTGADQVSADNLAAVMESIRWEQAPSPVTVDIEGLTPGTTYEIQLLFNEGGDRNRHWDIGVEGELVVDNITSEGLEGVGVYASDNSFAYVGEFEAPADGILNIDMRQQIDGSNPQRGADNNPILQAVVVHLAGPGAPFIITKINYNQMTGKSEITWTSSPGASYSVEFSPDMTLNSWVEVNDSVPSQGAQTTYTDPQARLGPAGYYRVRR
ncbi:MAG: hypothetical protein ACKV19_14425 [Verrucomicrobiales bacterium]